MCYDSLFEQLLCWSSDTALSRCVGKCGLWCLHPHYTYLWCKHCWGRLLRCLVIWPVWLSPSYTRILGGWTRIVYLLSEASKVSWWFFVLLSVTWDKLVSPEKREPGLRKCLYPSSLQASLWGTLLINGRWGWWAGCLQLYNVKDWESHEEQGC